MRRWVVLSVVAFAATIGWMALSDARRGYHSTRGARVIRFTLHSRLLRRDLGEILVTPRGGGRGRFLLVWLHGRSAPPSSALSDSFFQALRALGPRAPDVLFANGGDHSYWPDTALARELRADGARLTFHIWPGGHGNSYWQPHLGRYFAFYARSCAA